MNLIVRMILVFLRGLLGHKLPPLGESRLKLRVWPNDLDINLHMNNGRFLTIMDLGRFDLLIRTGLLRPMLRKHWQLIAGSANIRFFRPLNPWQRYQLHSQVRHVDDKWFYIEQHFLSAGKEVAVGYVKVLFRYQRTTITPRQILETLNWSPPEFNTAVDLHHWS